MSAVLEVIACSVADAVAAEAGGAHRLEIVRDLHAGGLAPAARLIQQIRAAVSIPVRVMLRENAGFEAGGEAELAKLCDDAREVAELGIDGFVIGFLRGNTPDLVSTERILSCAGGLKATFHRAFEYVEDKDAAIASLKAFLHFDRILTSGGASLLQHYAKRAAPEMKIVAGGGLDAHSIENLITTTSIREFHVGRAARFGRSIDQPVDAQRVKDLVRLLAS